MYRVRVATAIVLSVFLSGGGPVFASLMIGNQSIGSTQDSGDSNWMNGSKVTTGSQSLTVTSMSAYVGPVDTAPNNQYQFAIYADNGGVPGARIAVSATGTLTGNAWNSLPVSATLQPGSNYWLLYNSNGRTAALNNMYYSAGGAGAGVYSNAGASFGTWPSSFGPATKTNAVFSIYLAADSATVDMTPPTVTVTAPSPNATVSGVVTITADASDNVGVGGVQFQVDQTSIGTEVTAAPYAVSWDSSSVSNGTHALAAIARDTSGNTTTSSAVT